MTGTTPGIHPNLDLRYARFGWQERQIVYELAKVWFITFAKVTTFKDRVYSYVFARPTQELNESFRLEREVLILFTRDAMFEARTLDFVDKTIFEFQARLDKLCFLLVSQDRRIREKIRLLTSQEPETRMIVPFSYAEFLEDHTENLIMGRLKEFFYGRDLFAFESPLQNDTYFFGRGSVVQFFYDKYKSGENSGLFGLRKIGKTSVLFALKRYMTFRDEFAVFIDCQEPSLHKRRWYEVLEFVIRDTVSALWSEKGVNVEVNQNYTEKDASSFFEQDLLRIYEALSKRRLLLIFDEIENITFGISPTEHWNKGEDFILFWQSIRSVFQKNPNVFSFFIAGVNPRIVETGQVNEVDNPIWHMITPVYLRFFDAVQVKEMVSTIGRYMGLEFDEEIYTYLTEDFGGHPFLIRQVCSKIHNLTTQSRPVRVSKYEYKDQKEGFDRSLRDYCEVIVEVLRRWYPKEYQLLEMLAIGNKETFREHVNASSMLIEHLIGYNLVECVNNDYHLRIKAVGDYLSEHSTLVRKVSELEDKWQEVTKRRNKLEMSLRKCIKLVVKQKYGAVKGKDEFLKVSVQDEKRKSRLQMLGFDQLFTNDAELYFDELRRYVSNSWADFEKIFLDKELFDIYTALVNRHRIDAHAKTIDDHTYNIVIIALDWLNSKLDQFLC